MNLKLIGQFLTANNLWERKLSEFGKDDIRKLGELFFVAMAFPGDDIKQPMEGRCLVDCKLCFYKPEENAGEPKPFPGGVLTCGYCGRPVFDLYYEGGCPLGRWR